MPEQTIPPLRGNAKDLTGKRFGRLVVQSLHSRTKLGTLRWRCICDCGNHKIVQGGNLKSGSVSSCRCLQLQMATERAKKRTGDKNPNWRGGIDQPPCPKCGKALSQKNRRLCMACHLRENCHGLPKCRICGGNLSRYLSKKEPNQTRICQKCYRGSVTAVWNSKLTKEQRADPYYRSRDPRYHQWQEAVRNRGGRKCVACGEKRWRELIAHHVLGWKRYPAVRYRVSNGALLCRRCHVLFHMHFGWQDATRKHLKLFLKLTRGGQILLITSKCRSRKLNASRFHRKLSD